MKLLFIILLAFSVFFAKAQENVNERHNLFNIENRIALQGYDVVSYFQGKPIKGNSSNKVTNIGIEYYFSNSENKEAFKKNPAMYEPAYGGWCAFAMGDDGTKVKVDPETFKIIGNKLYLFYNFYFTNTLKKWNLDEKHLLNSADKNWSNIILSKQ